MSNIVPTILIGLGGIGSSIVDKIYEKIPENKRDRVAIHAFDTNLNDIAKLKHLGRDQITQTSSSRTVGQYLRDADDSVKDWFPYDQPVLLDKSLTEGAGQVRAISRLAYRAAIEEGKLDQFVSSIKHIFRATGEDASKSTRVMIISTLAGGTGAGIFIQTAMYVRDVLKEQFHQQNVIIKGAFLLPDVLVKSDTLDRSEIESVYANTYASIKELNAITINAGAVESDKFKQTIELEYKTGQRDRDGRPDFSINRKRGPYDFCFLFDFENTNGENLKYLDNYIQQVVRSIYIDLFSPIAGGSFSKQDNQIMNLVENNGKSRYVGAGVASLIYPYKEMIEYCSLRWAKESLSQDWLYLDEQFEIMLNRFKDDRKNGIKRDKPDRGEEYLKELEQKAGEQKVSGFFKEIHASLFLLNEDEEVIPDAPKAKLFIQAVEKFVEDYIGRDKKLIQLKREVQIDEEQFENEESIVNEVSTLQRKLKNYKKAIQAFLSNNPASIVYQVMLEDQRETNFLGKQDYRINTWILAKDKPLHPVAIRAFLYECLQQIEEKLKDLKPGNDSLFKRIDELQYYKNLEYEETDGERIRTPSQMATGLADNKGFWRFGRSSKLKTWANDYIYSTENYADNHDKYLKNKTLESIFLEIRKQLEMLANDFERYFLALQSGFKILADSLEISAVQHQEIGDMTRHFVLGDKKYKEKLWEKISAFFLDQHLPHEVSTQIYTGQYERFCLKQKNEYVPELRDESYIDQFQKDILGWCRGMLEENEELNMNCIQALNKESSFEKFDEKDRKDHLSSTLIRINNLAMPFSPKPKNQEIKEISAWGLHPDCLEELSREATLELFGDSDLVDDESFSRYSILRSRTNYGYLLKDFDKFYCGSEEHRIDPGAYYQAYQNRINSLERMGNTITPHLDKRWHNLAYLQDINKDKVNTDQRKVSKAFLWGLMMNSLELSDDYGMPSWMYTGGDHLLIQVNGERISTGVSDLKAALYFNPGIVDRVLDKYEVNLLNDKKIHSNKLEKHRLYQFIHNIGENGARSNGHNSNGRKSNRVKSNGEGTNILELIIKLRLEDVSDEELEMDVAELLELLVDEILDYHLEVIGDHRERQAKKAVQDLMKKLREGSHTYNTEDKKSRQYKKWKSIVEDRINGLT